MALDTRRAHLAAGGVAWVGGGELMVSALWKRPESGHFKKLVISRPLESKLPRLVADVAREASLSAVVTRIAASFVFDLGARAARVHLLGPDGRTLDLAAARNVDGAPDARLDVLTDAHPAARAARSASIQLLDDEEDGRANGDLAFALPLLACSRSVGAVSAIFGALAAKDCDALGTLSAALGALVERAQLRDEVARARMAELHRREQTALIAHDMRQPLNVIMIRGSDLARRSDGEQKKALESLRASGGLLDRMIDDLTDVSFLEMGQVRLVRAPTDLAELVGAVVARHASDAQMSVAPDLPRVDLDPQRIEQVLMNLLVNAKKHGRPDGATRVEIDRRGDVVVVSVTNEGDGILEEDRGRIFDAHYQARGHDASGLGLGLHICKNVVEQHGGQIWAESDATGTRLRFSLPIAPRDVSAAAGGGRSGTVLG